MKGDPPSLPGRQAGPRQGLWPPGCAHGMSLSCRTESRTGPGPETSPWTVQIKEPSFSSGLVGTRHPAPSTQPPAEQSGCLGRLCRINLMTVSLVTQKEAQPLENPQSTARTGPSLHAGSLRGPKCHLPRGGSFAPPPPLPPAASGCSTWNRNVDNPGGILPQTEAFGRSPEISPVPHCVLAGDWAPPCKVPVKPDMPESPQPELTGRTAGHQHFLQADSSSACWTHIY